MPEAEEHLSAARAEDQEIRRKLPWLALTLGLAAVAAAIVIGVISYRYSIRTTEQEFRKFYLCQARLLAIQATRWTGLSDSDLLILIEAVYQASGRHAPDEYVCIVDDKGRLVLHTLHPDTVGNNAGDNVVTGNRDLAACSLKDLPGFTRDYVGGYVSSRGQEQLAAFVHIPEREWTLGVHRSRSALSEEITSGLNPLLYGLVAVCGLMMPLSLLLLYLTFHRAQKSRLAAEAVTRWEIKVNDALADLSRLMISPGMDLETMAALIARRTRRLTGARQAVVTEIDPQGEEVVGWSVVETEGGSGRHPDQAPPLKGSGSGRLSVPVKLAGETVGRIAISRSAAGWTAANKRAVEQLAELLAVALDRFRAEKAAAIMETQMRQSQKMEAIGTLAGGIAHDFNNILAAIIGYSELLLDDIPLQADYRTNAEQILAAGQRARMLTSQILSFSRQRELEKEPTDMAPLVTEALKLLRATTPVTIEIADEVGGGRGRIMADPTQIIQVVMNIATNAVQAMAGTGGRLRVGLEKVVLSNSREPDGPDLEPGEYQLLTIADTGPGMDAETLERIFEPFYTTKERGQGTGMGLAAVHGIVLNHNGAVAVTSLPGLGATFRVYFPVVAESVPYVEQAGDGALAGGTEHILLLDDEQPLIDMGRQVLERLGYRVTATTSATEAMSIFRAGPGDIDVVISDVTMPEFTGAELARRMLSIRPDVPIILCTGYSDLMSAQQAEEMGIRRFLLKPLDWNGVGRIIRQVMDAG